MNIIDQAQQHLGDAEIQQISDQLGVDPAQARTAIQSAMPMMLAGMANTAQHPDGSAAIEQASDAHVGLLDNLGALLGGAAMGDGGGLLGKILGQHQGTVQSGVEQHSGLNSDQTRQLLMMLAPMVLAMLAKRRQGSQSPQPVDAQLNEEAQHAEKSAPHMGGILGKILSHVQSPRP